MPNLEGKTIVVIGAAVGAGRATAKLLADAGADVTAADLDGKAVTDLATQTSDQAMPITAWEVDVTDENSVRSLFASVSGHHGGIDGLVNTSAVLRAETADDDRDRDLLGVSTRVWDLTMAVNLKGAMLCCKHVVPHMKDRGRGSIVLTSSIAAFFGNKDHAAYGTSKAGLIGLTKYVAAMFGEHNIRCNVITPGQMMTESGYTNVSALDREQIYGAGRMLPEAASPVDFAHLAAFLLSEDSRYITGQAVVMDGGTSSMSALGAIAKARTRFGFAPSGAQPPAPVIVPPRPGDAMTGQDPAAWR